MGARPAWAALPAWMETTFETPVARQAPVDFELIETPTLPLAAAETSVWSTVSRSTQLTDSPAAIVRAGGSKPALVIWTSAFAKAGAAKTRR